MPGELSPSDFSSDEEAAQGPKTPGWGTVATAGSDPKPPSVEQDVQSETKGLTYAQEQDPSSAFVKQLAQQLGGLPYAQAQSLLKNLPQSVQTAVDNALAPPAASQSSPLGFDPLSMGLLFTQVLGPWMQQQAGTEQAQNKNYATVMQQALAGASPQTQTAFKTAIPAMQEAMAGGAQASENMATTEPQFEALIQGLNQATTAAKGTQYAVAELPYAEASAGVPATTYAAMLQAALSGQGAQQAIGALSADSPSAATLQGALSSPATPASTAAQQQLNNMYSTQLLAGQLGT